MFDLNEILRVVSFDANLLKKQPMHVYFLHTGISKNILNVFFYNLLTRHIFVILLVILHDMTQSNVYFS